MEKTLVKIQGHKIFNIEVTDEEKSHIFQLIRKDFETNILRDSEKEWRQDVLRKFFKP